MAFKIILQLCIAASFYLPTSPFKIRVPKEELYPFVSKDDWGGRPSSSALSRLNSPVQLVVIHHSYEPKACYTREHCIAAMRSMQDYHQLHQGWLDIGYNFAVGSDGAVYEGRGWQSVGAHSVGVNQASIGIVLIGDWVSQKPPENQLQAAQDLILSGISLGFIDPSYTVIGHRQVSATECPGEALYDVIRKWPHFDVNWKLHKTNKINSL